MSIKILEKNGVDNTNIDGAGFNKFCAGGYDGVIKGILNECDISSSSMSSVEISTGEILISGFRIVLSDETQFTMGTIPSEIINYNIVAEIVVDTDSEVTFRLFIQPASLPIVQNELFKSESGQGTYQFKLASFDYSLNGIENLTKLFKLLDNDYKVYVNNKIETLDVDINTKLSKKVSIEKQVLTEQEKAQARQNIGAISSAQSMDNVKYVYIVGTVPYSKTWLSNTVGGVPLIPQAEIIYIIKTYGTYYNQQYIYNYSSELYELTAQPSDNKKADKVSSAIANNFAGLDENGNLKDSGSNASDFLTEHQDISGKEDISNKVTSISSSSTDTEYPSAKSVYNYVSTILGDIETALSEV